jgi:predicted O-methyltransferase YrrM
MNKKEHRFLYKSMKRVPDGGIVVEIGCWKGGSSVELAKGIRKYCPRTKLFCVDFFNYDYYMLTPGLKEKAKRGNICETFKKNMKGYPHKLIVESSEEACLLFEPQSIDFIFIDADHSYGAVKKDIAMWLPKIKTDGLLCGHDYYPDKYGVKQAVDEAFGDRVKLPARSIWAVRNG